MSTPNTPGSSAFPISTLKEENVKQKEYQNFLEVLKQGTCWPKIHKQLRPTSYKNTDNSLPLLKCGPTVLRLLASFPLTGVAGVILQTQSKAIKSSPVLELSLGELKGSNASIFQYQRPFCFQP